MAGSVGDVSGRGESAVDGGFTRHERSSYGMTLWAAVMSVITAVWMAEHVSTQRVIVTMTVVMVASVVAVSAAESSFARWVAGAGVFVCVLVGGARSVVEWSTVDRVTSHDYSGAATVVSDPDPVGRAVRVVLRIDGVRFESWVYGRTARIVSRLEPGRVIAVDGRVRGIDGPAGRRLALRHVLGRFEVDHIDVESLGVGERGIDLIANRLRRMMRDGAGGLDAPLDELFAGLVYGDDRAQPDEMIARFRASGLAHLTAVSGQNVVYVLSVFGVLITRLRRWWRLTATVAVLGWFVVLTRAEPSVLRAATMATVAAIGFAVGGRLRTSDVLAISMVVLVAVDPFLVWSVGWWLSIGGTLGLVVLNPRLTTWWSRVRGRTPGFVAGTVITTVSAQCGVLPVASVVFGWPNALSTVCNVLAVPVAGVVMLVGIPVSMVAGLLPASVGEACMWPVGLMVSWVDRVASLGSRFHPWAPVDAIVAVATAVFVGYVSLIAVHRPTVGAPSTTGVPTLGDGRVPLPRSR